METCKEALSGFAELKQHVMRSGKSRLDIAQQDPGDATKWREARLRDY